MRLTLVDNLLLDEWGSISRESLQPHLGLMSLAGVARDGGHDVQIVDPKIALHTGRLQWSPALYEDIAHSVLASLPAAVGITSLGCNFHCAVRIARALKQQEPELPILLGGPHATILATEILRAYSCFDLVCRHEAEQSLLPVLASLEQRTFDSLLGVTFRRGTEVISAPDAPMIDDLDTLPAPAFEAYPIESLRLETFRVEAGRGCPFHCYFCSTAPFFGRRYRLKSAARLCSELQFLNRRYRFTNFSLTHDLFTVNKKKVREFCEAVGPYGFTWGCSARVDCVDASLLRAMSDAGCRRMYFGIETGSERMQRVSRKRLDLDLVLPILQAAADVGIGVVTSFITGYPEEEQEDQNQTLQLMNDIVLLDSKTRRHAQLHLLAPEPGTELHERYRSELRYDGWISDQTFAVLDELDRDIIASDPTVFMVHFHFPSVLERSENVFVTSAFRLLVEVGADWLATLLRRSKKTLAQLICELSVAPDGSRDLTPATYDRVTAFVARLMGEAEQVTSAYRITQARAELMSVRLLSGTSHSTTTTRQPQRDRAFVASEYCRVLMRVHRISLDLFGIPTTSVAHSALTNVALLLDTDSDEFIVIELDDVSCELLRLLVHPRKIFTGGAFGSVLPRDRRRLMRRIKKLVDTRLLVPADAVASCELEPAA